MPFIVGIVGAGKRVETVYLPVLRALSDRFTIGGIVSRTRDRAIRIAALAGARAYDSAAAMRAEVNPDAILVAVSSGENANVALELLKNPCALLLETPLASDVSAGRRVVKAAAQAGRPVGVAEQKPFLPFECFKRELIAAGAIGKVLVVENHFRAFQYHAVAQMRRCLPVEARPLWVRSVREAYDIGPFRTLAGDERGGNREHWTFANATFTDGSMAVHSTSSLQKKAPFRIAPALSVYGSRGSIVNDAIAVVDASGETRQLTVTRSGSQQNDRISTRLPDGSDVVWDNPVSGHGLDDDQVAVALHLLAMRDSVVNGGRPLYSLHDALVDIEMVEAMDQSARRGGAPVFAGHACADASCRPLSPMVSAKARLEHLLRSAAGIGALHKWRSGASRFGKSSV